MEFENNRKMDDDSLMKDIREVNERRLQALGLSFRETGVQKIQLGETSSNESSLTAIYLNTSSNNSIESKSSTNTVRLDKVVKTAADGSRFQVMNASDVDLEGSDTNIDVKSESVSDSEDDRKFPNSEKSDGIIGASKSKFLKKNSRSLSQNNVGDNPDSFNSQDALTSNNNSNLNNSDDDSLLLSESFKIDTGKREFSMPATKKGIMDTPADERNDYFQFIPENSNNHSNNYEIGNKKSLGRTSGSMRSIGNYSQRMIARKPDSRNGSVSSFRFRNGRAVSGRVDIGSVSAASLQSNNGLPSRGLITLNVFSLEILTANRIFHSLLEFEDTCLIGTSILSLIQNEESRKLFKDNLDNFKQAERSEDFVHLFNGIILEFTTKSQTAKKLSTWSKVFQKGKISVGTGTVILIVEEIDELTGKVDIDLNDGKILKADDGACQLLKISVSDSKKTQFINTLVMNFQHVVSGDDQIVTYYLTTTNNILPISVRVEEFKKSEGFAKLCLSCLLNISGLLIINSAGIIQSGNETFLKHIFGYSMSDLVGKHFTMLLTDFSFQTTGSSSEIATAESSNRDGTAEYPSSGSSSFQGMLSKMFSFNMSNPALANLSPKMVEATAKHSIGSEFKVSVILLSSTNSQISLWISLPESVVKAYRTIQESNTTRSFPKLLNAGSISNSLLASAKIKINEFRINDSILRLRLIENSEDLMSFFDIEKEIGKGTYGVVQLATDQNGNQVSLKMISKSKLLKVFRDERYDDLPKEIIALQLCSHENIIKFLQAYESPQDMIIVTEYFTDSIDLFQFIDEHPQMPENVAVSIFRQVASALLYCHDLKIAHRDIKEENVLINSNLQVKLIDFGSATLLTGPDGLNEEFKIFFGTLEYSSPEVLMGKPYKGLQNDVWALGITLYSMIYTENAFTDIEETLNGILNPPFEASHEVQELLRGMLNNDAERRFSMKQVIEHQWLHTEQ